MLKSTRDTMLSAVAGAVIGLAAWGHGPALLLLSTAVVPLWAVQPTRTRAGAVVLGYYLAAAHGLPIGAATYYGAGAVLVPLAMWLGTSLLQALAWAALWARRGWWWRVPALMVVSVVPPLGLIGWTHPITAAGELFPGLGWAGLGAVVLAMVLACYPGRRLVLPLAFLLLVLSLVANNIPPAGAPRWIVAHSTHLGGAGAGGRDFVADYAANMELINQAQAHTESIQLYPESVAGVWSDATAELWHDTAAQLAATGRTVIVGAEMPLGDGRTANGLVMLGQHQGRFVQRVPVPATMWRPWADDGTQADVFGPGVWVINGHRAAVLICYEQVIGWPVLASMSAGADVIIGAANVYWANGTNIPAIQRDSVRAWGRLFGVPVITATNS